MRYKELELGVKLGTYIEYRKKCKKDDTLKTYTDFKEYDKEQTEKNLDFDTETYKCLE